MAYLCEPSKVIIEIISGICELNTKEPARFTTSLSVSIAASRTSYGSHETKQVEINLIWSAFIQIYKDSLSGTSLNSWKHHMVFITNFWKLVRWIFCLGGKILTPVSQRLEVISEWWPVANRTRGTFWSGRVKYELRKLNKCVDLIKCSLTFTNEPGIKNYQNPHVEPTCTAFHRDALK